MGRTKNLEQFDWITEKGAITWQEEYSVTNMDDMELKANASLFPVWGNTTKDSSYVFFGGESEFCY